MSLFLKKLSLWFSRERLFFEDLDHLIFVEIVSRDLVLEKISTEELYSVIENIIRFWILTFDPLYTQISRFVVSPCEDNLNSDLLEIFSLEVFDKAMNL